MKLIKKIIGLAFVFALAFVAFSTTSHAATVGQQLTSAEDGWKRFDDREKEIVYNNKELWINDSASDLWKSTGRNIPEGTTKDKISSSYITFKFYGSKIRFIQTLYKQHSKDVKFSIDGKIGSGNTFSNTLTRQVITYENTNLEKNIHTVKIYSGDGVRFDFDAIDIDNDGYLIDVNQPTDLRAKAGNNTVDLEWTPVENATYKVGYSTTPGGPYKFKTVTGPAITYGEPEVKNGTQYYFVVSAVVSGVESSQSNEVSATPEATILPDYTGNKANLRITMVTGEIKEFDLTNVELNKFLEWNDKRSDGIGKAYYVFTKKSSSPYLSRKEYIVFDKISSFEVMDYNE